VRTVVVRMRLLKDESGFTLTEILVTTIMMVIVLSALYSLMDMSLRAFTYGNNKVEAVETSRVALEKMEREIRQAYPYQRPDDMHLFDQRTANEIRFGNDLDGNRVIQCPNISVPAKCEKIGYRLNGTTLGRDNTSTGATNTTLNLQPVAHNVQSLTFTYYNQSGDVVAPGGTEVTDPTAPNYIDRVQVTLVVSVGQGVGNPATQTLTSTIDLRNR
jgi:prepilin-type N-terminal cleavage/methylation domain-containing protein